MRIVNLSEEHLDSYCMCLEDWSDEIKEAGDHKACWYNSMKDKGLAVKLALDKEDRAVGMIQYLPAEHSYADAENHFAILCIWVHGYKNKGVGNHQKKGIGTALLKAAEKDVLERGAAGMVAWGLSIPVWMKASWFKKHGYKRADKLGFLGPELVWKAFSDTATPPLWIRQKKKPELIPGKVTVTAYLNGWCPAQNMVYERARRASGELGDGVIFRSILTSDRDNFLEWGIGDALFIDEKKVNTGPPPSYRKIKRKIARQLKHT